MIPLGLDQAHFYSPIAVGDCVTFTARCVQATAFTCRVNVAVEVRDPDRAHRAPHKADRLVFVFATRCPEHGVLPETYAEILMHIDAQRASLVEGPTDDEARRLLDAG